MTNATVHALGVLVRESDLSRAGVTKARLERHLWGHYTRSEAAEAVAYVTHPELAWCEAMSVQGVPMIRVSKVGRQVWESGALVRLLGS